MIVAQAAADPTLSAQILPFAVLAGLFYVFMIRPQRRRASAARALRDSAAVGDNVRTIGGIHGVVTSLDEDVIVIAVEGGSQLKLDRRAIAKIVDQSDGGDG